MTNTLTSQQLELFLSDFAKRSSIKILEEGQELNELYEVAKARNINLENNSDLSCFKSIYAFADVPNLNGAILPEEAILKYLPTVQDKPVNINHIRNFVIGHIIDYRYILDDKKIVVYGVFYKSNFPEEWEKSKEDFNEGKLTCSFEIWSNRQELPDGSFKLINPEMAGMAILDKDTPPAYPGAKVLDLARYMKVYNLPDPRLIYAKFDEKNLITSQTVYETEECPEDIINEENVVIEEAPYKEIKDLPPAVKDNMSEELQRVFLTVWNNSYRFYLKKKKDNKKAEDLAFKTAWNQISKIAVKDDKGIWKRKENIKSSEVDKNMEEKDIKTEEKIESKVEEIKVEEVKVEQKIEQSSDIIPAIPASTDIVPALPASVEDITKLCPTCKEPLVNEECSKCKDLKKSEEVKVEQKVQELDKSEVKVEQKVEEPVKSEEIKVEEVKVEEKIEVKLEEPKIEEIKIVESKVEEIKKEEPLDYEKIISELKTQLEVVQKELKDKEQSLVESKANWDKELAEVKDKNAKDKEQVKRDTELIVSRKIELGEYSKDLSEQELLDNSKFELIKLKKENELLRKACEDKLINAQLEKSSLTVGGSINVEDILIEASKKVTENAFKNANRK